jgi:hypothetical protein
LRHRNIADRAGGLVSDLDFGTITGRQQDVRAAVNCQLSRLGVFGRFNVQEIRQSGKGSEPLVTQTDGLRAMFRFNDCNVRVEFLDFLE